MIQRVRGLRFFVAAAVLTCLVSLAGSEVHEAAAQETKRITVADALALRVEFQARAYPADPFDPDNAVNADAKKPLRVRPGQTFRLIITGTPKGKFYTYAMFPGPGMSEGKRPSLKYKVSENAPLQPLKPVVESASRPKKYADETAYVHTKPFTWTQDILVLPDAKSGTHTLEIPIFLMACDESNCVGPDNYTPLKLSVEVAGEKVSLTPELEKRLKASNPWPPLTPIPQPNNPNPNIVGPQQGEGDLGSLLVGAFLGAFLMLLTPCVFPMIPITVNFFLKQSEKEHHSALLMACVYSGTIIVLLTAVMMALGPLVIELAINPIFNLAMGALLIFFALSLFGMYEIQLPSALTRFTSSHEGQGGYIGALFMALTFTITSFTCTGPFLGAMIGGIASVRPPWHHLLIGSLVYSATFAAPFFVLALFPGMLKKLPKSGGWMNGIKVTMAFVEVAAALKFLSRADVDWNPGNPLLFNYDTVLCAWIALSVASGLYLIGAFRLPHDHESGEPIGVMRMMFAILFFGLAVYMTPALFGIKPAGVVGENLMAFLPQSFRPTAGRGGTGESELVWHKRYEDAWKEALAKNVPILIDFTGVNCENCRYNEQNIFPDKRVQDLMKDFARAQLYTDSVPDKSLSWAESKKMAERYTALRGSLNTQANPSYFLIWPSREQPFTTQKDENGKEYEVFNGKVYASEFGKVFDVNKFINFLKTPPPSSTQEAKLSGREQHQEFNTAWNEARHMNEPVQFIVPTRSR